MCTAFHCDITASDVRDSVPTDSVDVATMIFVLSAIHPDKMQAAVHNVWQVSTEHLALRNLWVLSVAFWNSIKKLRTSLHMYFTY